MQKLPVIEVIHEALGVVWERRVRLAQALLGYVLFFAAMDTLATYIGEGGAWLQFGLTLVSLAMLTLFAVTCHRIVLLDGDNVPRYGLCAWTPRETRFLGWSIALYLVVGILMLTFVAISAAASAFSMHSVGFVLALLPSAYVFSRLSALFPATAIDQRRDMQWAWELTEGNGWRLTVLIAVIPGLIAVLESRLSSDYLPLNLIGTFGTYALTTIEIAMLSVSFRRLKEMRDKALPPETP